MKLRVFSVILLLSAVLSACKPADQNPASVNNESNSAQYQKVFEPSSNPASVDVSLDETRAVESVIPIEGGTLRATGADGTQYVLNIPGDALLTETKIRLIPAAVSGMPFGGEQTHAAQLEPEGLTFNNFATLTINPPVEIPIAEQLFFGYQEAGKEVIFAPPDVESNEIKLLLLHFSGYGVTKGLLADPESVRERLGGSAERRLQSLTAELLGRERQRQLLGGEADDSDTLQSALPDLFDQYEQEVIEPRVAAAGESCAAGRLAMQTVLGHERQKQLLGISEGGLDQYAGLMDNVSRVCLKEEYEMCAQDHIIHRMVPVWLGLERQAQLLGAAEDAAHSELSQYAIELTKKCLNFELVFESQAVFDDGGGGGYDSSVNARVPLHFDEQSMKISGSSALINNSFTFRVPGCSVTSNRGGSTMQVSALVYITDTHSANDALGYVRDFKLSYFPERTKEVFTVACEDQPPYTSPESGLWSAEYLVLHQGELSMEGDAAAEALPAAPELPDMEAMMAAAMAGVNLPAFSLPAINPGGGFVAEEWEIMGGEFFAKKEWIKEDGELGLVEAGTFKLYHRPGQ